MKFRELLQKAGKVMQQRAQEMQALHDKIAEYSDMQLVRTFRSASGSRIAVCLSVIRERLESGYHPELEDALREWQRTRR